MTWFYGYELGLFADNAQFPIQTVVTVFFRDAPFKESVLLSVFWVPWVKLGHYQNRNKKEKLCIIV